MLLEVRAGFVLVPLEVAEANRGHFASLGWGGRSVFLGINAEALLRDAPAPKEAEIVLARHAAAKPKRASGARQTERPKVLR